MTLRMAGIDVGVGTSSTSRANRTISRTSTLSTLLLVTPAIMDELRLVAKSKAKGQIVDLPSVLPGADGSATTRTWAAARDTFVHGTTVDALSDYTVKRPTAPPCRASTQTDRPVVTHITGLRVRASKCGAVGTFAVRNLTTSLQSIRQGKSTRTTDRTLWAKAFRSTAHHSTSLRRSASDISTTFAMMDELCFIATGKTKVGIGNLSPIFPGADRLLASRARTPSRDASWDNAAIDAILDHAVKWPTEPSCRASADTNGSVVSYGAGLRVRTLDASAGRPRLCTGRQKEATKEPQNQHENTSLFHYNLPLVPNEG